MDISLLVGWAFLILSWVFPSFIEDKTRKRIVGASLSAFATGIFIGAFIQKYSGQ